LGRGISSILPFPLKRDGQPNIAPEDRIRADPERKPKKLDGLVQLRGVKIPLAYLSKDVPQAKLRIQEVGSFIFVEGLGPFFPAPRISVPSGSGTPGSSGIDRQRLPKITCAASKFGPLRKNVANEFGNERSASRGIEGQRVGRCRPEVSKGRFHKKSAREIAVQKYIKPEEE